MAASRCLLGRLSVTPFRSYLGSRFITSSPALWSNGTTVAASGSTSSKKHATIKELIAKESKPPFDFGFSKFMEAGPTKVTGTGMFYFGVCMYLISKEKYIINTETLEAVVQAFVFYHLIKRAGKPVADYLDGKSQMVLDLFNSERDVRRSSIEEELQVYSKEETNLELRHDIFEVLKENASMRLEEEYRRRLHEVSNAVKRQLDYHVVVEQAERKFQQSHMVQWLEGEVTRLVEGKQEESFAQCMSDLKKMAA